jgi:hypothetical protein
MKPTTVPELYAQLERAYAAMKALDGYPEKTPAWAKWEQAVGRCANLAERIAQTPAGNVAEILIKLRTVAFDIASANPGGNHGTLADFDRWQPRSRFDYGTGPHAIASVRDDLVRLFGALDARPVSSCAQFQKPLREPAQAA